MFRMETKMKQTEIWYILSAASKHEKLMAAIQFELVQQPFLPLFFSNGLDLTEHSFGKCLYCDTAASRF